ncbi:hypothetical protein K488DRAFT_26030, partial [Vararia minispora EC-137]
PLICVGADARCAAPVPIPAIERTLTPPAFARLLAASFATFVASRPREMHYCPTPDCAQVYRVTTNPTPVRCPACRSTVCTSCHGPGHGRSRCRSESQNGHEEVMGAWIERQEGRVKRCPECGRLLEKMGGCNHITCNCGAHLCWQCMRAFPSADIYLHISSAHFG